MGKQKRYRYVFNLKEPGVVSLTAVEKLLSEHGVVIVDKSKFPETLIVESKKILYNHFVLWDILPLN